MPATAALIDELRTALGVELVDKALRRAKTGAGVFYAVERLADGTVCTFGQPPRPPACEWVIPEVFEWRVKA